MLTSDLNNVEKEVLHKAVKLTKALELLTVAATQSHRVGQLTWDHDLTARWRGARDELYTHFITMVTGRF